MRADSPQSRLRALLDEYNRALKVYFEARDKAKTADERDQIAREKYPEPRSYSHRFLELAESAPDDPAAADALVWIIERSFDWSRFHSCHRPARRAPCGEPDGGPCGHDADPYDLTGSREALPRHHRQEPKPQTSRGWPACRSGATTRTCPRRSEASRKIPTRPASWKAMMIEQGPARKSFDRLVGRDPDVLMKQAEDALERAAE